MCQLAIIEKKIKEARDAKAEEKICKELKDRHVY